MVVLMALTVGWLLLVAAPPAIAGLSALIVLTALGSVLLRYGSLRIEASPGRLRAGDAHLEAPHLGRVESLDPAAWRTALDRAGVERGFLLTRPWIDRGVRVEVDDPADPTPYWLLSTRRPDTLARVLGHTGAPGTAGAPEPRSSDGEEARDDHRA